MSTCIKEIYDYGLVKKWYKCGIILLKSNFHKKKLKMMDQTLLAKCVANNIIMKIQ